MHNTGYKSALTRRACRYSDARPPRKTDGVLLESELPPRMRGKDCPCPRLVEVEGITPAYAGKRNAQRLGASGSRDHPRVCGEKTLWSSTVTPCWGSPPHMRGKVAKASNGNCGHGITPPYAGKRHPGCRDIRRGWDHPRICGEKQRTLAVDNEPQGSPPHMRGKGKAAGLVREADRITPAYAGKRQSTGCKAENRRDHPRVCGEKGMRSPALKVVLGSPPRMRGKVQFFGYVPRYIRITPAYAGKSQQKLARAQTQKDHPRVCGEKDKVGGQTSDIVGSPPRMRGKATYPRNSG